MNLLSFGRKALDQLRQTTEVKIVENFLRKSWYQLGQTDEEMELEKLTQEAVRIIADELEIPSFLYEKRFPFVHCNPFFLKDSPGETFYRPSENIIVYGLPEVPPYYIFEEAGHFLQFCTLDQSSPPENISTDTLTRFFFSCNLEAVGFFCSRLSGDKRENDYGSFCQGNEVLRRIVEESSGSAGYSGLSLLLVPDRYEQQVIEEICRSLYGVISASLASPPITTQEVDADFSRHLISAFLSQAKSWQDEYRQKYPGFLLVVSAENVQGALSRQGVKKLSLLPQAAQYDLLQLALLFEDNEELYEDISHLVGYNLGAALFHCYEEDPEKGKQLVCGFMQVPYGESLPAFFHMHRELHDAGYSPLEQLTEILEQQKAVK